MSKKKLVAVLVAAVLALAAYFYGPEIVDLVKEQVNSVISETETEVPVEVAPLKNEPSDTDVPTDSGE